jgi:uncharacterized protein YciI
MQFLLVAYDATDEGAAARRLKARDAHLKLVEKNKSQGHAKFGAALIEEGKMVGSVMVLEYETQDELHAWLDVEPYVVEGVWHDISISECKIAPSFIA